MSKNRDFLNYTTAARVDNKVSNADNLVYMLNNPLVG